MRHFPIFMDLRAKCVVIAGASTEAEAKLRLLLKTEAHLRVYGDQPTAQLSAWADAGRIELHIRDIVQDDIDGATLVYGALDDAVRDEEVVRWARERGIPANIVDNLDGSDFITPAIVDRDPVTVAIGTEGAAPVLARKIKADLEENLPPVLGNITRIGRAFRKAAEALPKGRARRRFWTKFYYQRGPRAWASGGPEAVEAELQALFAEESSAKADAGFVSLVGAGPGDPELLTLKARNRLHEADVVLHDALVPQEMLELARREATIIETGKRGFRESWSQDDIEALMIAHAQKGHHVVRLKAGDPAMFGRMDEEIAALDEANIGWDIVPGITAASAAAADMGTSLTRRGRNSEIRFVTGHDVKGYAEQDWRALARPGKVAAIYMGVKGSAYLRGRLLMHGADPSTPVTAIENASRPDRQVMACELLHLPEMLAAKTAGGPVVILLGLLPHQAETALKNKDSNADSDPIGELKKIMKSSQILAPEHGQSGMEVIQ